MSTYQVKSRLPDSGAARFGFSLCNTPFVRIEAKRRLRRLEKEGKKTPVYERNGRFRAD